MKTLKAWVAAVGTIVTVLSTVLADEIVTSAEWGSVAQVVTGVVLGLLTVYGVWRAPNTPDATGTRR